MRWTFYLMSDPADIRSSNNSLDMDLSNCKSLLLLWDTGHPWVRWSLIVLHHAPSRLHWFTQQWGGGGLGVWKENLVSFMTCRSCTEFVCWLLGLHTRYRYCFEMWWGLYRATFLQHLQQGPVISGWQHSSGGKLHPVGKIHEWKPLQGFIPPCNFSRNLFHPVMCNILSAYRSSFLFLKEHMLCSLVRIFGLLLWQEDGLALFLITSGLLYRAFHQRTAISCFKPTYSSTLITFNHTLIIWLPSTVTCEAYAQCFAGTRRR